MSRKIWIVLQHRDGQLHRMAREAVAAGQKLAAHLSAEGDDVTVDAVLLGSETGNLAEQAAGFDLGTVRVVDHPALENYNPGAYVGALAPAIRDAAPDYVIFPHTYQSVDYVARLAQAVDAPLVPEAISFEPSEGGMLWKRPVLGGKLQARVRVRGEGTVLLTVQSGAFPGDDAVEGSAEVASLEAAEIESDRELLGVEQVGGEQVDLSAADVVVAVGRGIGKEENLGIIEELAEVLGADVGASRPVVDNGWLPRDRQIGSSGQTVAPKLYLAIGISGAIQHLVGMKGASTVVSINKDPSAPIFAVSDYGIVGDLHEVVPALTEAIREAKG